jgi:hypothetical protein
VGKWVLYVVIVGNTACDRLLIVGFAIDIIGWRPLKVIARPSLRRRKKRARGEKRVNKGHFIIAVIKIPPRRAIAGRIDRGRIDSSAREGAICGEEGDRFVLIPVLGMCASPREPARRQTQNKQQTNPGKVFETGGVRFRRYDCQQKDDRGRSTNGWSPGQSRHPLAFLDPGLTTVIARCSPNRTQIGGSGSPIGGRQARTQVRMTYVPIT